MILIDLGAGVALILLGVRFLRKGLDRLFGGRLIEWLRHMTGNRFSASLAGMAIGAFSASSTGLSLLTSQILGEGKIVAANMLAVLLGGSIGITLLAHLVSFNLKEYAGFFVFLGSIGFLFSGNQKVRGIGQCVLALGFIFMSMSFIDLGSNQIGANRDMNTVLHVLQNHPVLLALLAAVLAVLMQSSTASIGLGVGLAASTALRESDFLPWVLGTNVGLGFTSLIVCWGTLQGRRLAYANLFAKAAVALLFAAIFGVHLVPVQIGSVSTTHLLPVWHTIFNVVTALIALPFLGLFLKAAEALFVPEPFPSTSGEERPESFLDPQALESASIALAHATREVLRLADDVRLMMQHLVLARQRSDVALAQKVKNSDDRIDDINQNIMLYLGQLGEDLNDYDQKWQLTLLNFSNELETTGDVIEKNLCDAVIKQISEPVILNAEESKTLDDLFVAVIRRIDVAASLVSDRNASRARSFIAEKNAMEAACLKLKQVHFQNLRHMDRQALYATLCFLDMMDALQRVNNHVGSVAYLIASNTGRSRRPRLSRPEPPSPTLE